VRAMARLAVHLFFRRIDIEAPQSIPTEGPILIVANHTNALVDPLVIVTAVRRRITVTAKHALLNNVLLRWIMSACGVITFHRQHDAEPDGSQRDNLQSLRQCEEILARGGAICIFPEGVSHSDSKLRAFRNGAARIALEYVRQRGNPGRLQIAPAGLLYTAKDRFRSDVWLRFGDPIDVETLLAKNPNVHPSELTHVIEQRVASLTINTPTRREQYLLTWAAEIVATGAERPKSLGAVERSTAEWFRLIVRLQSGWDWLNSSCPDLPKRLANQIRAYRKQLRRAGIVPGEVYLQLNWGRAAFFLLRELELMMIGGPMALFGLLNHAAPYFVVKRIATKLSHDKDHWASNAIYPSFVVFPFFYLVQLAAAWLLLPTLWASVYTIALPYTGYYAMLYGDRFQRAWRRARTFIRFALRPAEQQQLATEGREIVEEIRTLGKLVEREQNPAGVNS
jgi:glycerol-3-phosphate O-acyltransferase/dihydroxyacetone phosphate acyltransferase